MALWSHTAVSSNDAELVVLIVDECRIGGPTSPVELGSLCTSLFGIGGTTLCSWGLWFTWPFLPKDLEMCALDGPEEANG